ncbi:hypothetical protein P5G64_14935 [Serratia nevei]|uniref:hypothetical protein n=1 Tax=Serratia TaxID=613 RepID=UPI0018D6A096|nr:hypothetical protein [Serratia marcescens]MDF8323803.1 hypothetical protein [Serratia nevei]MBH2850747.1 hypothetical protein [Serratia marcescens]MBK5608011.1 hypothetical protein [Serratia marcescens]MDF8338740.1 hypothetical protein [Serratia nevei]MDF8343658.1 hypothetical protein [Serratia nevei]
MSFDISVLGYLGLLIAAPAIFVAGRVAVRSLLSAITPQDKVSITYTDIKKNKYKTVIYINKDEELLKLIDDIAAKNQRERKESASHV